MSMSHAAPPAANESDATPPESGVHAPRFSRFSRSERQQYAHAPEPMKPAMDATFERASEIVRIDSAQKLAIVVFAPSVAAVVALWSVLGIRDWLIAASLFFSRGMRVFSVSGPGIAAGIARAQHTNREQAHAMVYGPAAVPVVARVPRATHLRAGR